MPLPLPPPRPTGRLTPSGKRDTGRRRRWFRILYAISDCLLLRHTHTVGRERERERGGRREGSKGRLHSSSWRSERHSNAWEHLLACFTRHKLKFINILCTTCVNVSLSLRPFFAPSHSRTLSPSFFLSCSFSYSQSPSCSCCSCTSWKRRRGNKRPERATFLAVSQCEKITERCVQWSRTAHTL